MQLLSFLYLTLRREEISKNLVRFSKLNQYFLNLKPPSQTTTLLLPCVRRCGQGDTSEAWAAASSAPSAGYRSGTSRPCRGRYRTAPPGGSDAAGLRSQWTYLWGRKKGREMKRRASSIDIGFNKWKEQRGEFGVRHSPTMMATRSPVSLCSFTSWMRGLSPGATALLMTVRALTWVTERTVAAAIHGRPNRAEQPPSTTISSRSRWKPEPLVSIRSFLLTIRLQGVRRSFDINAFFAPLKILSSKMYINNLK